MESGGGAFPAFPGKLMWLAATVVRQRIKRIFGTDMIYHIKDRGTAMALAHPLEYTYQHESSSLRPVILQYISDHTDPT